MSTNNQGHFHSIILIASSRCGGLNPIPTLLTTYESPQNSVAILVSEILDLVSPKDFGMT